MNYPTALLTMAVLVIVMCFYSMGCSHMVYINEVEVDGIRTLELDKVEHQWGMGL